MPKLSGIFEKFSSIENIPLDEIRKEINFSLGEYALENFIANHLFYPQAIPSTNRDIQIDFALLKGIISRNIANFYNSNSHRVTFPKEILQRFPPTNKLLMILIDTLKITGINQIFIQEEGKSKLSGSIVKPINLQSVKNFDTTLNGKTTTLQPGSFIQIPTRERHIKFKFNGSDEILVSGGSLGLIVDLRK